MQFYSILSALNCKFMYLYKKKKLYIPVIYKGMITANTQSYQFTQTVLAQQTKQHRRLILNFIASIIVLKKTQNTVNHIRAVNKA